METPVTNDSPDAFGLSLEDVGVALVSDEFDSRQRIVERITFSVERGRIVGLFGPSGVGKSTILNAVAGIVGVSAGSIRRCDRRGMDMSTTAYATQRPTLLPWYSLRANFEIVLGDNHIFREAQLAKAERWCEMMGLATRLDARPRKLSGGMQQRANLIRALICPSPILLLDEPMSGTEHICRGDYLAAIKTCVTEEQRVCLFVSHDRDDLAIADTVVVLGGTPSTVVSTFSAGEWRKYCAESRPLPPIPTGVAGVLPSSL